MRTHRISTRTTLALAAIVLLTPLIAGRIRAMQHPVDCAVTACTNTDAAKSPNLHDGIDGIVQPFK